MSKFDKTNNTQFRKLNLKELKEFKEYLKRYNLSYRNNLDINPYIQFGVEVEFNSYPVDRAQDFLSFMNINWKAIEERSLAGGGEIVSPILHNTDSTWEILNEICSFLSISGAQDDELTGAHIHVGADIFGYDTRAWHNLAKMIMAYENVIYRYSSGEYNKLRNNIDIMAYPIAIQLYESISKNRFYDTSLAAILFYLGREEKFQSFNFKNVKMYDLESRIKKNTIEYRLPNGTFEPVIWQNNINMFIHLLNACKGELDEKFIKHRIRRLEEMYDYKGYDKIDDEGALHFVDQIFNNDVDKAYFLRQYYKDFEEADIYDDQKLVKNFIK
jgi:hypothetical protein